jgi:hypothetical protein
MTDFRRTTPLFATIVLILAACGGGGGGDGGGATSPAAPADGGATTDAPASEAPPTDAPAEPAGGGGTAAGVCELVTADELAKVFNVPSVTTTVFQGPPDTCSVDSDAGAALVAWSFSTASAKVVYESLALESQSIAVPGIGDKAAFVDNTGLLVLKGDALVVIGVMSGVEDLTEEERNELAKQIGAIAAGRM